MILYLMMIFMITSLFNIKANKINMNFLKHYEEMELLKSDSLKKGMDKLVLSLNLVWRVL